MNGKTVKKIGDVYLDTWFLDNMQDNRLGRVGRGQLMDRVLPGNIIFLKNNDYFGVHFKN